MKRLLSLLWTLSSSLLLLAVTLLLAVGCTKDDNLPSDVGTEDDAVDVATDRWPTEDIVNQVFSNKSVVLASSDNLISFLLKRLKNVEYALSDDVYFVLLDETSAATILSDEALYSKLRTLWNVNRFVGFLKPGHSALTLLEQLRRAERYRNEPSKVTNAMVDDYKGIMLYVTRADNTSYVHNHPDTEKSVFVKSKHTGKDGVVTHSEKTHAIKPVLNNYEWGCIAEALANWLNNNHPTSDLHRALVDTRASVAGVSFNPSVSTTWSQSITVNYEEFNHDKDRCDDEWPAARTVTTTVSVAASGSFNTALNMDIYDVQVRHYFPTSDIWKGCVKVGTPAAYTNKFAGFTYVGPTFKYSLDCDNEEFLLDATNVQIFAPVPIVSSSTVTTTHDPGSTTLGGSLSGGGQIDGGTSGINGGGHFDVGFSADFTLPKDFTAVSHQEMPFTFEDKDGYAKWSWGWYKGVDVYELFDFHWGRNATYIAPPDVTCTNYNGNIGVSFAVANSRNINTTGDDINVYFCMDVPTYTLYCELATTWDFWEDMSYYADNSVTGYKLQMPTVYRYFEKFIPSPKETTHNRDWPLLKELMSSNVNFNALCDEAIMVGAEYYSDVDGNLGVNVSADEIWRDCLTSLITQYHNTSTGDMGEEEWIIGIADSNGVYLPRVLHIKGSSWTMVEDYSTINFPTTDADDTTEDE